MSSTFFIGNSTGALGDLPLGDGVISQKSDDLRTVYLPTTAVATDGFYNGMAIMISKATASPDLAGQTFEIVKYTGATRKAELGQPLPRLLSTAESLIVGVPTKGRNTAHLSKEYLGVGAQTGSYRLVLYTGDSPPKRIETSAITLAHLGHSRGVILAATAEMGETKVFDLVPVMAKLAKVAIAAAASAGTSGVYLGIGVAERRG